MGTAATGITACDGQKKSRADRLALSKFGSLFTPWASEDMTAAQFKADKSIVDSTAAEIFC